MTIREIRESTGLSQQKFGDALGVPLRSVQNWEGGQNAPPPYPVELIAYRVRTDPDFPRKTPKGGDSE